MLFSTKAMGGRLLAASFFCSLMGLSTGEAVAASFQVNPVNIVVPPGARAASVAIRNTSDKPVSMRVLTFRWTQENGQDVQTPTNELIASPPIFTIATGASQLVRVGLKGAAADQEQAYRVVFEEIPSFSASQTGIQVAVRLDLPFYKLPKGGGTSNVFWSGTRAANGEVVLTASNRGALHQQITEISTITRAGARMTLSKGMGVVLPGSSRQWKLGKHPDLVPGTELNLLVRNSGGETQAKVRLDAR